MFKPQRLGTVTLPDDELTADKKTCRKIGPCGVFQLDKPDFSNDRFVDSKYVSVPREEELLDHSGTGNIHECSFHDIFLLCRRVSGTFYEGCLSGRNYPGSSIPWNLYPCYKETNESIVVRQCNLNT